MHIYLKSNNPRAVYLTKSWDDTVPLKKDPTCFSLVSCSRWGAEKDKFRVEIGSIALTIPPGEGGGGRGGGRGKGGRGGGRGVGEGNNKKYFYDVKQVRWFQDRI